MSLRIMIRPPAVAGTFYPRQPDACRGQLQDCLDQAQSRPAPSGGIGRIVGGIVPHAGWICSGPTAARVFSALVRQRCPEVVIVFGAIHVPLHGTHGYLYPSGSWQTPLGLADVDANLADCLLHHTPLLDSNPHAHDREHSIEVEVPFLQHLLPQTKIIPIMVPVHRDVTVLGDAIGNVCKREQIDAVFLASTDLTHYGPAYGFTPRGIGAEGLRWAKEVNDRRLIDLMLAMRAEEIIPEAVTNLNACGAGAIAATLAACTAMGASRAIELEHTTSHEVLRERVDQPMRDAVGYAALIFHS